MFGLGLALWIIFLILCQRSLSKPKAFEQELIRLHNEVRNQPAKYARLGLGMVACGASIFILYVFEFYK